MQIHISLGPRFAAVIVVLCAIASLLYFKLLYVRTLDQCISTRSRAPQNADTVKELGNSPKKNPEIYLGQRESEISPLNPVLMEYRSGKFVKRSYEWYRLDGGIEAKIVNEKVVAIKISSNSDMPILLYKHWRKDLLKFQIGDSSTKLIELWGKPDERYRIYCISEYCEIERKVSSDTTIVSHRDYFFPVEHEERIAINSGGGASTGTEKWDYIKRRTRFYLSMDATTNKRFKISGIEIY